MNPNYRFTSIPTSSSVARSIIANPPGSVDSGSDDFTVVAEGDEFRIAEVPT